jgi:hypothetical protein
MTIIYEGPSLIDGAPVVVVAIVQSGNSKTGNMVQTYILCADIDPRGASKSGADFSICGNCAARGIATNDPNVKLAKRRKCYVTIGQGPLIVWRKYQRGGYALAADAPAIATIGADRMVRLGTYGDPAAVPAYVWRSLLSLATGHTGYSHQSAMVGVNFDPSIMMVSADSREDAQNAWNLGARTFRVIPRAEYARDGMGALVAGKEIMCPASKESGYRTTCERCLLCSGTSSKCAKSVAIVAHGASANLIDVREVA